MILLRLGPHPTSGWEEEWTTEVQGLLEMDAGWGWRGFWECVYKNITVSLSCCYLRLRCIDYSRYPRFRWMKRGGGRGMGMSGMWLGGISRGGSGRCCLTSGGSWSLSMRGCSQHSSTKRQTSCYKYKTTLGGNNAYVGASGMWHHIHLYISHLVPLSLKAYLTDDPLAHRDLGKQLLVILALEHLDLFLPSLSFLVVLLSITRGQLVPEGSSSATYIISHPSLLTLGNRTYRPS